MLGPVELVHNAVISLDLKEKAWKIRGGFVLRNVVLP